MAVRPQVQPTFGRGSPVLDYWLAHSEGFRVRGRRGSAVVETVFVSPHGRVTALEVRGRLVRRRRVIPAASVQEVVPAERLLVATRPLRARARTWFAIAARAARPGARRLGALALRGVRADAALLRRCSVFALRGARRFAVAVDGDARRLWVGKTKLAGARAGTTISRSYARASAGASVARTVVLARARAASRSSSPLSSWSPERARRSSERPQRRA